MRQKIKKVIQMFKKSGNEESDKIELDNLTMAKLTYDADRNVVVENEYGTQFSLDELSDVELDIFIYILNY